MAFFMSTAPSSQKNRKMITRPPQTELAAMAAPLAEATGLESVVIPELREVLLGDWEGGELRIRAAQGDPLFARMLEEERWDVIPNAEPMERFAERVRTGV